MNAYNFLAGTNFCIRFEFIEGICNVKKNHIPAFYNDGNQAGSIGELILYGSQANLLPSSAILSLYSPANVRRSESLLTEKFFLEHFQAKRSHGRKVTCMNKNFADISVLSFEDVDQLVCGRTVEITRELR